MQCKRGEPIEKAWPPQALSWVDRFGNTALHIGAALGAEYQHLRNIIRNGVSIHEVNTAGQTFMHVLDPRNLSVADMFSLKNDLRRRGFNFRHVDVRGKTFLDFFKYCGMEPLALARCWLILFLRTHESEQHIMNYDYIKAIFDSCGGSTEHWNTLGWIRSPFVELELFRSCRLEGDGIWRINKRSWVSREAIQDYIDIEDHKGRSYLHDTAVHPFSNRLTDLCRSGSYALTRPLLARVLLKLGAEINHHDRMGETPLMTSIRFEKSLMDITQELLDGGANLNSRNLKGQSALHISIKLGKISVTKALIHRGANIHARDWKGRGVLAVAEDFQRRAKNDESLYARISACMVLAIDAGAIARPNVFHEWDLPESIQSRDQQRFETNSKEQYDQGWH